MAEARTIKNFAINVFDDRAMLERLPKQVYKKLKSAIEEGLRLDEDVAEVVATAMKEWAISRGATYYTHWFHPRTELTAEKHSSFLSIDAQKGIPLETFAGEDLIQGEPDASSFPSGGMRSTFEARGYTAWDPSSPAFVIPSEKGGTLCIPSVFISNDGTPLDMKTPLLKALTAVENRALKLLKIFGNRSVKWVKVTMGAEQEFFLIDAKTSLKRPDILFCGRTLMGVLPPKGQQMEDHYFGSIHPRVLAFMEDVAEMMGSLGMVLKTRHNEVAPCQFEFAPQFSEANLAVDQNQILMEQMRRIARQHGLRLLLHEKPFPSINGSGKHMNFSLIDSEGRNLLKPPTNQKKSLQFLTLLSSLLLGVAKYGGLLRASVATPGNMHRLGGNEAPPAIISVYLGDVLTQIMAQIEKGLPEEMPSKGLLDIGLNRLPTIRKENTDRNRTAPLAFTGDKFEFRAPGASQSPAGPLTMILAVWAWGMDQMLEKIESRIGSTDIADAALDAIKWVVIESKNVRFEGNCYSPEWIMEAKRRELPIAETTYDALRLYLQPEHMELLSSLGIMTEREIASFYETKIEQYNKTLEIEMTVMESMVWEGVLPAISKQVCLEGTALKAIDFVEKQFPDWQEQLESICEIKNALLKSVKRLSDIRTKAQGMSTDARSEFLTSDALPFVEGIRGMCDAAEKTIASEYWPYPRYRELLNLD